MHTETLTAYMPDDDTPDSTRALLHWGADTFDLDANEAPLTTLFGSLASLRHLLNGMPTRVHTSLEGEWDERRLVRLALTADQREALRARLSGTRTDCLHGMMVGTCAICNGVHVPTEHDYDAQYLEREAYLRDLARREGYFEGASVPKRFWRREDYEAMSKTYQALAADDTFEDRYDWVATNGRLHHATLDDLLATMKPVALDAPAAHNWRNRTHTRGPLTGQPWLYTPHELITAMATFAWNDNYFDGHGVPTRWRAGRISAGSDIERFIYFPNQVFAVTVVKRAEPLGYIVAWRESVGFAGGEVTTYREGTPPSVRANAPRPKAGRQYRVWQYHYTRRFTERVDAEGFARALGRAGRREADLQTDALESEGHAVMRSWDRDEFAYDPHVLTTMGPSSTLEDWADLQD